MDELTIRQTDLLAAEIIVIDKQTGATVMRAAMEIGRRLIAVKELIPHGDFGEWLREHLNYSERKAQNMMKVFTEFGRTGNPEEYAELDFSKAVALLGVSGEERRELVAKADDMSVRELSEEVKRLKAEAAAKQVRIDELVAASEDSTAAQMALAETRAALSESRQELEATNMQMSDIGKSMTDMRKEKEEALRKARELEDELSKAQSAPIEPAVVEKVVEKTIEVVPEDVQRELDQLRAKASEGASDEATILVKAAYARLGEDFAALLKQISQISGDEERLALRGKVADKLTKMARLIAVDGAEVK